MLISGTTHGPPWLRRTPGNGSQRGSVHFILSLRPPEMQSPLALGSESSPEGAAGRVQVRPSQAPPEALGDVIRPPCFSRSGRRRTGLDPALLAGLRC